MPAPVVIDVGVAEPPRDLAVALVDACTQAAMGNECRLLREVPNGPYTAIAIVTWEEGDRARVEVGLRRDPVSEWRTRELTFQHADADVERYRTVGFVIGGLATAARDEDAPSRPPEAAPAPGAKAPAVAPPPKAPPVAPRAAAAPVVVEPSPVPTPAPVPSRGWIGVAGSIGGGLDEGSARYGGRLDAGIRVIPHLSAIVSLGASVRGRDAHGVSAQWLDAGIGLSFALFPPEGSHLELRGEVLVEHFSAEAEGGSGSNIRTAAAGRVGFDGVLRIAGPISVVAGGEGTFRPATILDVDGESVGATRNFELGAVLGPRVDW
jgi:hypothetical protein